MATEQISQTLGPYNVIDKRRVSGSSASPISSGNWINTQSMATLDAALSSAYWTQARLDATCLSDKIHALRVTTSDGAGIS